MKSERVKVAWRFMDILFQLDLRNGKWEVDDTAEAQKLCLDVCRNGVSIKGSDGCKQHAFAMLILQNASRHGIDIPVLILQKCIAFLKRDAIRLSSGYTLPESLLVKKIQVEEYIEDRFLEGHIRDMHFTFYVEYDDTPWHLQGEKLFNLFHYCMTFEALEEVLFEKSILPLRFPKESISEQIKQWRTKVSWRPADFLFLLDFHSGHWKVEDVDSVRTLCRDIISIEQSADIYEQTSTVLILQNASKYKIRIPALHIGQCFNNVREDHILLNSGLFLPNLLTVEKLHLAVSENNQAGIRQTNYFERVLGKYEVLSTFQYGLHSLFLQEISFHRVLLPLSIPLEYIPAELKERNIKVFWRVYGYRLCLHQGIWKVDDTDVIKTICSKTITLCYEDNKLQQEHIIHVMENASNNDIRISCLYVDQPDLEITENVIKLQSGIILPKLLTLEKLHINIKREKKMPKTLTEEEVIKVLIYGLQSVYLKEIWFNGCLLPLSITLESLTDELKSRTTRALWIPYGLSLHPHTGRWTEIDDINVIKEHYYDSEFVIRASDHPELQKSVVALLGEASKHQIPISSLRLHKSFCGIGSGGIILHSGVRISHLSSVEKIEINTEGEERAMTETETVELLQFAEQSQRLIELRFIDSLLPRKIQAELIPLPLKSRNVKVVWSITFCYSSCYLLRLETGAWMDERLEQEMTIEEYERRVQDFQEYSQESLQK